MKITALSDIHNRLIGGEPLCGDIESSDLVVVSGDITSFSGRQRAELILEKLRSLNNAIIAVAGNCDTARTAELLEEYGISAHRKCLSCCGVDVVGANGDEGGYFGSKLYKCLVSGYSMHSKTNPLIVLTHQPGEGTKVSRRGSFDRGSKGVRKFIDETKPILAFSGHIHEAFGTDKLGKTTLINPGSYGEGRYAVLEVDTSAKRVCDIEFKTTGE